VPSQLREAAHTCEFREVLQRGPKIAACLVERSRFELSGDFAALKFEPEQAKCCH
jgi:hypothetical protein